MRLDKTNPANVTASQPNGGKSESLFDSSNYNPSSEMEKKRKMSPFLTVKPSTAICKDNDDVSNNLAADNSAPGEGNAVSSSMTPPMIPNISSPSFVNSVLNSSRSESKQTSSTAFPTTLSGGGEGQRHVTNTYTNLLRTMNSDTLSSASGGGGGDGMYSMSSVHFSDSRQSSNHRSPFPPHFNGGHEPQNRNENPFLISSGAKPSSCPTNQHNLQQHYGQFFQPKLDSQPSTFDDRGGHHISSAFHPLHNASKYNSRPFRSDSSRTSSYESPNFLKLSSVSDNRGSFSNLRGANPGDNSFQSTLSYHLANKFSKRHLNQR